MADGGARGRAQEICILLLEDSLDDAELLVRQLRDAGFAPQWQRAETEAEFLDSLKQDWDVILGDYNLPQFDALHALALLRQRQ